MMMIPFEPFFLSSKIPYDPIPNSISQTATVQATVYMMVGGAVVAAFDDLAFDLLGYLYVLLNDLFTASYSVYIKKKLDANVSF